MQNVIKTPFSKRRQCFFLFSLSCLVLKYWRLFLVEFQQKLMQGKSLHQYTDLCCVIDKTFAIIIQWAVDFHNLFLMAQQIMTNQFVILKLKKKKNAGLQIRRRWWVARVLPQGANASWEQDSAKYNFKIIAGKQFNPWLICPTFLWMAVKFVV